LDASVDVAPEATRPVDATPGIDTGNDVGAIGIACGADSCTIGNQQCCLANVGGGAICVGLMGGGCPAGAPRLRCDDSSDCPANQVCCASPMGAGVATDLARCLGANNCANMINAQVLCDPNDPTACMQGDLCSPTPLAIFPNRPFCHAP
jgi:hypothetical protein